MEKRKVPALRFKDFTQDWEQRKLGELVSFAKGHGYSKSSLVDEGVPIVLYGRLYTAYETIIKTLDTRAMPLENSVYSIGGEVVVPASGETADDIAIASVVENAGVLLGGDLNILYPSKNINPKFLAINITSGKPHYDIAKKAQGKSVVHVHNDDLAKVNIQYPNIKEQEQISNFQLMITNLITLHQRKLEKLKKIKKSMLEKMFPKNNKKIPEIRFSAFFNDWEQRKLGSCAEFNPQSELPDEFEYVDLESVVGTNMISHRTEYKSTAPSRAQRLAKQGDVFYQTVRPYQRNNYLFDKPLNNYVFSTGYAQLRPYINSDFLMTLLQNDNFVKVVLDSCTGTSYPAINSTDLAKIEVNIPESTEEQRMFGVYFRSVDHLITLHQRKLEKLKKIKKSMLEKMFV